MGRRHPGSLGGASPAATGRRARLQPVTAHTDRFAPVDQRQLVLPRPDVLELFPGQPKVEAFGPDVFAAQDPERAVAGEEAPGQLVEFGDDAGLLEQFAVRPFSWRP